MRRLAKAAATGVVAASVGVFLALTPFGIALEGRSGLSWLFWLRGPIAAPDDVVVVSLDRESGERLGYPDMLREWPRSLYARLVERLADAGASVVVLDVIFDQERDGDQDAALARAMNRTRRVVLMEKLDRIRSEMSGRRRAAESVLSERSQLRTGQRFCPCLQRIEQRYASPDIGKCVFRLSSQMTFVMI